MENVKSYYDWVEEYPFYVVIIKMDNFFRAAKNSALILTNVMGCELKKTKNGNYQTKIREIDLCKIIDCLSVRHINFIILNDNRITYKGSFEDNSYGIYIKLILNGAINNFMLYGVTCEGCIAEISRQFDITKKDALKVLPFLSKKYKEEISRLDTPKKGALKVLPFLSKKYKEEISRSDTPMEETEETYFMVSIDDETYDINVKKNVVSAVLFLLGFIPVFGNIVGAGQLVKDCIESVNVLGQVETALFKYIEACFEKEERINIDDIICTFEKPKGKFTRKEIEQAIDNLVDKNYLKIKTDRSVKLVEA